MVSPFAIVGPRYAARLAADLHAHVQKTGAHWEQVFECLDPNEQATLAPFLRDVALMQASRKSDAAQMAGVLRIAVTHGMANTTLCAQAAEFLARLGALIGGR
jgi:hypothetical protein